MKNFTKIFFLLTVLFVQTGYAQTQQPEMADVMRSNGKIYVVVGIILIVLIGLFTYLFTLDRKIGKLESKLHSKK
jgi:nitrogen fixation/metabolism regulation signal transduction histidine kinase